MSSLISWKAKSLMKTKNWGTQRPECMGQCLYSATSPEGSNFCSQSFDNLQFHIKNTKLQIIVMKIKIMLSLKEKWTLSTHTYLLCCQFSHIVRKCLVDGGIRRWSRRHHMTEPLLSNFNSQPPWHSIFIHKITLSDKE